MSVCFVSGLLPDVNKNITVVNKKQFLKILHRIEYYLDLNLCENNEDKKEFADNIGKYIG